MRQLVIQFATLESVDQWVREHFHYQTEPYEIVMSPELALINIQNGGFFVGDCDDVATLEAALFKALQCGVRFVAIRTEPDDAAFLHVFVEVQTAAGWQSFDPTVTPNTVHVEYGRMEMNV